LYWIDNARYWLETFVIMKHTMVYVGTLYTWNTWWQPGLASFFETFMMPMFCACSGYLSKGTPTADRCLRVLFRAWVPFVIVNVFYEWIDNGWTPMRQTYTNVLNSLEVSWFLCCWIQWRLLLPYICALPPGLAVAVSYMLSWFSGYWFDSEPTFHQVRARCWLVQTARPARAAHAPTHAHPCRRMRCLAFFPSSSPATSFSWSTSSCWTGLGYAA